MVGRNFSLCAALLTESWENRSRSYINYNIIENTRENSQEEVEKARKDALEMGKEKNAPPYESAEKIANKGNLSILLEIFE